MKKINTFWNWFQDNNQRIKNLINETPENQKHIAFWINKNLSYYCREIDFIIVFPKKENSKTEFIVTANGNSNYFQQVTLLIDNAPRLRTWNFTAFLIPREQINKVIEELEKPYIIRENTLKAAKLHFLALDHDEETQKFEIWIYLKNYNLLCSTKTLDQAIFIIVQNQLTQESLSKNSSFVQLAHLPDIVRNGIKLQDLQYYLDSFKID
jgi:predicted transcriptional regulator YdeE